MNLSGSFKQKVFLLSKNFWRGVGGEEKKGGGIYKRFLYK